MRTKPFLPALIAISLLATGTIASAQMNAGGGTPGSAGVIGSPAAPPAQQSTGISSAPATTTGTSTTSGSIGTSTRSSSGLPGDNPSAPGFPGKVGR